MELQTTSEIFHELGGIQAVAELTGSSYKAASNWKSFGRFPAKTYLPITQALSDRGLSAPPKLWGMYEQRAAS